MHNRATDDVFEFLTERSIKLKFKTSWQTQGQDKRRNITWNMFYFKEEIRDSGAGWEIWGSEDMRRDFCLKFP